MSETTDSSGSMAPLLDDSSADGTSQLPAADRTLTDLDAFTPDDAATGEASNAAEATGEIEALDILEVVEVLRASRPPVVQPPSNASHASSIPCAPPSSRALEVLETSRLPAVIIAGPQPSLPSIPMAIAAPHARHPSSIAPLAFDLTPVPPASFASASWRTPTPPDPRESTVEIARAAGIPSNASRLVVFTASVVGMCLVAGILGVMLGYSRGPAGKASTPSLAAPVPVAPVVAGTATPRIAVVTSAHEEITEGPILVPAKDAASMLAVADDGLATSATAPVPAPAPSPVAVAAPAPRSAPPAPVTRAAAPAPRVPSSSGTSTSSSTGVLRLPGTVSGVLIDGVPHKAGGGGLVVACGRHTVKAPGHPSRLVIIPCGGSAAL